MLGKNVVLFLFFLLVPFAYGDGFTEYNSVVGLKGEYLDLNRAVVVDGAVVSLQCELIDPFSEERKKLAVVGGISSKRNTKDNVFYCSGISVDQIKVHWEPLADGKIRLMLVISNDSKWKGQWSATVEAIEPRGEQKKHPAKL